MDRYTMSQARAHFGEVLDAAEQGKTVAIERKGKRFVLMADKPTVRKANAAAIEVLDPSLLVTGWTWHWENDGLALSQPRRRKKQLA